MGNEGLRFIAFRCINAKRLGKNISAKPRPKGQNVVDLMDALKKSLASETATPVKGKKPRKATAGQKEMLLPIEGKKAPGQEGGQAGAESWLASLSISFVIVLRLACHLDAAPFPGPDPCHVGKRGLGSI